MSQSEQSLAPKNRAKRAHILAAAKSLFAEAGLQGASLRAIAARAGYTPAALYFHFPSREAIYAEVLRDSLARLEVAIAEGAAQNGFRGAAMALFDFYQTNPQELALGFYLGGGGLGPHGLGQGLDPSLNAALIQALAPLGALAGQEAAAEAFALAVGLLVMAETRRIRLFGLSAREIMERHLKRQSAGPG